MLAITQTIRVRRQIVSLENPVVMGILNVNPDSFYEASRYQEPTELLGQAAQMLADGATILDIGGYSTQPNAPEVTEQEELNRVLPAIALIRKHFPEAILSIDTFRAKVAEEAIKAGADIINDVSGGQADDNMFDTVAQLQVPYILMHSRGTPQTMQSLTHYNDLVADIVEFFQQRIYALRQKGVVDIIVDPGFGFAKTAAQNFALLRQLPLLRMLGCPILVGVSRKSMIYKTLGITANESLNGTTALHMLSLELGASFLRVHDVKEAKQTVILWQETQVDEKSRKNFRL